MNLEEQIQKYKEITIKIQELEEQKKLLNLSITQVMTEKSFEIGNYLVKRFPRLSITTTLDFAPPAQHYQNRRNCRQRDN